MKWNIVEIKRMRERNGMGECGRRTKMRQWGGRGKEDSMQNEPKKKKWERKEKVKKKKIKQTGRVSGKK